MLCLLRSSALIWCSLNKGRSKCGATPCIMESPASNTLLPGRSKMRGSLAAACGGGADGDGNGCTGGALGTTAVVRAATGSAGAASGDKAGRRQQALK
ncbi:hypothetical protein JOS77_07830 [Chromobacterium haemolyticum]|nr:hypothetical protein JOS77_07830 [Chromobacterium haemolyticum]